MPLSNTVIRRYTPPTCTLEVLAQSSPLSRWMGKTVLKQLSFELRFDDPRLPEDRRLPIRGDRDQLEALCDAVTSYIQNFLQQTPDSFWLSFSTPEDSSKVADNSELTDFSHPAREAKTATFKSFTPHLPRTTIYLEPSGYLTHNLFLGSLANHASGPVIQLSLLQLFDLATALDEYSADVMALPNLNHSSSSFTWPAWTSVAAVLVLGVGLLPVTWQYVNTLKTKQPQIATKSAPAPEKVALQPSPPLTLPTPSPGLTPPDNLQPLPILGSASPPPSDSLPTVPLPSPNSNFSTTTPLNPNSSFSTTTQLNPNSSFPIASQRNPTSFPIASPNSGSVLTIPPGTTNPALSSNPLNPAPTTISQLPIGVQPNARQNPTELVPSNEFALPKKRNLPPSLAGNPSIPSSITPSVSKVPPPLVNIPNQPNPALFPAETREQDVLLNAAGGVAASNPIADKLPNESKTPVSTEVSSSGSLFDTPQVAEAREFFQKRWQPPTGLTQTLEYSLMLGVDGSIERIFPLNKAAREYVDMAGMPSIGKPFVSANRYGKNVRIRAVFSPDGKVQILPENE